MAMDLPNTICSKVDVTNREHMIKAIRHAEQALGPADAIINNAGCMFLSELKDQNPEDWETMIDVNLHGAFNGIHAVLPAMYQRGSGTIINIGSMTAKKPFPMRAAYGATKVAIHGLSEPCGKRWQVTTSVSSPPYQVWLKHHSLPAHAMQKSAKTTKNRNGKSVVHLTHKTWPTPPYLPTTSPKP